MVTCVMIAINKEPQDVLKIHTISGIKKEGPVNA